MKVCAWIGGVRTAGVVLAATVVFSGVGRAQTLPATQPATQRAPATQPTNAQTAAALPTPTPSAAPAVPAGDPTGTNHDGPLYTPHPNLPGFNHYADPKNPTNQELSKNLAHAFYSINFSWTLLCGFLVMFMQAGFALVETGLCRAKNAAHTMSMNFLVYGLGVTAFFLCGYAFMCGGVNGTPIGGPGQLGGIPVLNQMVTVGDGWGIMGKVGFCLSGRTNDASALVWFIFMLMFMDTAITIPTGALAERWSFRSFFIFSLLVGGFIYPIYGCWVWGGGWLAQLGMKAGLGHGAIDFAGSGVVHLQGGSLALITCMLLGPRIGKYDESGRPRPILGHHVPMVVLGTFILAFGWFGFNAGSSLAATNGRIGVVAVNTMLASASGAVVSCLYMWFRFSKPDPSMMCNGMLAGLVSITAACGYVAPWAAFLIGAIAGVLVIISVFFWERIGIDDPVGAISVHCVNGAWGLIALGLFADGTYGDTINGVAGNVKGLFYGDTKQFVAQLIDVAVCITWNVVVGGLAFFFIGKMLGSNRVPPEVELAGLDIPEVGAPGYPEFITPIAPETISSSQLAEARAYGGNF